MSGPPCTPVASSASPAFPGTDPPAINDLDESALILAVNEIISSSLVNVNDSEESILEKYTPNEICEDIAIPLAEEDKYCDSESTCFSDLAKQTAIETRESDEEDIDSVTTNAREEVLVNEFPAISITDLISSSLIDNIENTSPESSMNEGRRGLSSSLWMDAIESSNIDLQDTHYRSELFLPNLVYQLTNAEHTNGNRNLVNISETEVFAIASDPNSPRNKVNDYNARLNNDQNLNVDASEKEQSAINNTMNPEQKRTLCGSSASLYEHSSLERDKTSMNRSPLSKSAENVSTINTSTCPTKTETNFSLGSLDDADKIDQDEVLAEFEAHKTKVPLPIKVHENLPLDRFPRTHKEIITQDLGSIVKNVHGIFSSVSGSLKNAYNISQRNAMQNKQININKILTTGSLKNTTNGKIINNIFDSGDPLNSEITKSQESAVHNLPFFEENNTFRSNINEAMNTDSNTGENERIESMEKALLAERQELATLRERVKQQADELLEKERVSKENERKMESLRKRTEHSEREKNSAVMRYAVSESAVIGAREAAENAKRGEKAAKAELELLAGKLRSAQAEKQRICQIYDDKCHELSTTEREQTRLRDELRECDSKLKWTQTKLRVEMDAYKEAASNVERLTKQVAELQARGTEGSDPARVRQLESELKELQASLILCRHENEDLERRLSSTAEHLDASRRDLATSTATIQQLQNQVEMLSANNMLLEEEAAELASLRAHAELAETLALQLERETMRAMRAEEETGRERARAETCALREATALEHSARLTAEHVGERAQCQHLEAKARALAADNASLREKLSSLEVELTEVQSSLSEETGKRRRECQLLARKVAELTEELQHANKQLDWEKGENSVLKKRHASAVKELNRELQRALKRCEQLEARGSQNEPADAPSTRTGSISSLSSCDGPAAPPEDVLVNGHTRPDTVPEIQVREPDRQALIERIVQLQRAGARRAERCDFLEEHNKQLTAELARKAKLLRQLLASQPAGALAGQDTDNYKREMARLGGGAMAAVWGGGADGMTLELSLEINRKLQAVLEDSLLKNITLKENMDTLGAEIARLKAPKEAPTTGN